MIYVLYQNVPLHYKNTMSEHTTKLQFKIECTVVVIIKYWLSELSSLWIICIIINVSVDYVKFTIKENIILL